MMKDSDKEFFRAAAGCLVVIAVIAVFIIVVGFSFGLCYQAFKWGTGW